MFTLEGCEIFDLPFIIDNQIIAIPELWKNIEWNDDCYQNNISQYCINYFSEENHPDDILCVTDMKFFDAIKQCRKMTIFYAYPNIMPNLFNTDFSNSIIYNQVLENLIFIGYNISSYSGSAITDGLYPIFLENCISGKLFYNPKISVVVNRFGLVDSLIEAEVICKTNKTLDYYNQEWYPVKIYVDLFTYHTLLNLLSTN